MPDERWDRVWSLFHASLERLPEERAAFVDTECGDDPTLRAEVLELLRAHESGSGPLDRPLSPPRSEPASLVGDRIARYRVRAVVAEGGMGVVYDAEQEEPVRRRVALKVIRPGLDGGEALARFESERQALALMSHSNIAHALDAGATGDGRPWFAMEYVAGAAITEYADEHRLSVRRRVELLVDVCAGLQHAHQKGLLHRDVKPSNVLVTEEDGRPVPKIIDFGIAKALHQPLGPAPQRTVRGAFVGTPAHMSPEQLEATGIDIDTRSDIYSLGVLLYEVLAGVLPFEWDAALPSGVEQVRRVVLEQDPPPPSRRVGGLAPERAAEIAGRRQVSAAALGRELRGDLDWIVMKALERDRARRYASVSELAADLQRCLRNEPVSAGPPSSLYRASRFWRRHRASVTAAVLAVALLAGFAVAMAVQTAKTRRALRNVERERRRAEAVTDLLIDVFGEVDPSQGPGGDPSAREVLDRGAERVAGRLGDQPELQAALMTALGRVYSNLSLLEPAESLLQQGLELRRARLPHDSAEIADSLVLLGIVRRERGDLESALADFEEAASIRRKVFEPGDPRVGAALFYAGTALRKQGELDRAEASLREALTLVGSSSSQQVGRVSVLEELGAVAWRRGDLREALERYREAARIRRDTDGPDAPSTLTTLAGLGVMLQESGLYDEAEPILREVVTRTRRRYGDHHARLSARLSNLALLLQSRGEYAEAERLYREALAIARDVYGPGHVGVVPPLNNLALLLYDRDRLDEAEALFREAMAIQGRERGEEHPDIAFPMNNLARVLHEQGRLDEAERLYRRALEVRRAALPPGHPATASTLAWLGKLLVDRGEAATAEPLLREALAIRQAALDEGDWRVAEAGSLLGGGLAALGRYAEAEPLLLRGYERLKQARGARYRRTRQALERLVGLYEAWGREGDAARWRSELAPPAPS